MKNYGVKFIVNGVLPQVVEFMRYASIISVESNLSENAHQITMWCPKAIKSDCGKVWQEHQVKRLASFGFKASPCFTDI